MLSYLVKGLYAAPLELFEEIVGLIVAPSHNVRHLRSEYKSRTLSINAKLAFEVPQEVAEVNVKEMSVFGDHDIAYERLSIEAVNK